MQLCPPLSMYPSIWHYKLLMFRLITQIPWLERSDIKSKVKQIQCWFCWMSDTSYLCKRYDTTTTQCGAIRCGIMIKTSGKVSLIASQIRPKTLMKILKTEIAKYLWRNSNVNGDSAGALVLFGTRRYDSFPRYVEPPQSRLILSSVCPLSCLRPHVAQHRSVCFNCMCVLWETYKVKPLCVSL